MGGLLDTHKKSADFIHLPICNLLYSFVSFLPLFVVSYR